MKKYISIGIFIWVSILIFCCTKIENLKPGVVSSSSVSSATGNNTKCFGILIQTSPASSPNNQTPDILTDAEIARRVGFAKTLKAHYYRMTLTKQNWPNNKTSFLKEFKRAHDSSLYVVLNLADSVQANDNNNNAKHKFTNDPVGFRIWVDTVFQNLINTTINNGVQLPPPASVVVENEETNSNNYYNYNIDDIGTISTTDIANACQRYTNQLIQVVNLCKNYNWKKQGQPNFYVQIGVYNGGFTTIMNNQLKYDSLVRYKLGQSIVLDTALKQANNEFGIKAMPPHFIRGLMDYFKNVNSTGGTSAKNQLLIAKTYMTSYLTLQNGQLPDSANYLFNIHWYEPSTARGWDSIGENILQDDPVTTKYGAYAMQTGISVDSVSGAYPDVLKFYYDKGFTKMTTNEIGQITNSPALTLKLADECQKGFPYGPFGGGLSPIETFIFFSASTDGGNSDYKAKPYHQDNASIYNYNFLTSTGQSLYNNNDVINGCYPSQYIWSYLH